MHADQIKLTCHSPKGGRTYALLFTHLTLFTSLAPQIASITPLLWSRRLRSTKGRQYPPTSCPSTAIGGPDQLPSRSSTALDALPAAEPVVRALRLVHFTHPQPGHLLEACHRDNIRIFHSVLAPSLRQTRLPCSPRVSTASPPALKTSRSKRGPATHAFGNSPILPLKSLHDVVNSQIS